MVILIVDDEKNIRSFLTETLSSEYDTLEARNGQEALELLEKVTVNVVLCDDQMPVLTGLELIEKAKPLYPWTRFVMITAHGSIERAVSAMKKGADDFLLKPVDIDDLHKRVKRIEQEYFYDLLKSDQLDQTESRGPHRVTGESAFAQSARHFMQQASQVKSPVLIGGPSGTGKEELARGIHEMSGPEVRAFVAVNCASIPHNLMETEFFGHEKGAFTGADRPKIGKFELASGGTLFLDEIAELPLALQAKLLRVLQEKEFLRVGGNRVIRSQARIIAATHQNLSEKVKSGTFREDLFFRLNVLHFEMIPLRERPEDIEPLLRFFWSQISKDLGKATPLKEETLAWFKKGEYRGNIRELRNLVERVLVMNDLDFTSGASHQPVRASTLPRRDQQPLEDYLAQIEKATLLEALSQSGFNQVEAANRLGLKRTTLQSKMLKYGLQTPAVKKNAA